MTMRIFLVGLIAVIAVFVLGCSDEQAFKDSRDDFMRELKRELTENSVPYTVDSDGRVRYAKEYAEAVEQIINGLDETTASEIGIKYDDDLSTAYFRSLLQERNIPYRAVGRNDGEWTYWNPENQEEKEEIEMMVVVHALEAQKR